VWRFVVLLQIPALSPVGERVVRTGVLFSRCGPGEGVFALFDVTGPHQLSPKTWLLTPDKLAADLLLQTPDA
jgi:hypothetical protein